MTNRVTRRESIHLSSKGLVALMTALPYLKACGGQGETDTPDSLLAPDESMIQTDPVSTRAYQPDSMSQRASAGVQIERDETMDRGDGSDSLPEGSPSMDHEKPDDLTEPMMAPDMEMQMGAPERLEWSHFLEQVEAIAELQFGDAWDMETYVTDAAKLMQALNLDDPVVVGAFADYANQVIDFPEIAPVYSGPLFEVVTLEFEPGEEIGLHDHPDMTGVILCVTGSVEIDNFDQVEPSQNENQFLLKRSAKQTLYPGDVATLTATRGNIHSLRATEFTQLLDVFTPPYNDDRSERSRWFEREQTPVQGLDGQTYRAWLAD